MNIDSTRFAQLVKEEVDEIGKGWESGRALLGQVDGLQIQLLVTRDEDEFISPAGVQPIINQVTQSRI